MKRADILKLRDLGLISVAQERQILDTLHLKEDSSRLLTVLSVVGAVLVAAGIILLISANWDAIHRSVQLAGGIALMLAAYGAGWWLREFRGDYPKIGEALYLLGGGLWLANIALVGQIYNLSSRPPNAILLWALGLAALPWILRSKALFILSLGALITWFGFEMNDRHGLLGAALEEMQMPFYALVGAVLAGWSGLLRRTSWSEFAGPAFKSGLLLLLAGVYPICWRHFDTSADVLGQPAVVAVSAALFLLGIAGLAVSLAREDGGLNCQWRWTWGIAQAGAAALAWAWLLTGALLEAAFSEVFLSALATVLLFAFSLAQVQVGVMRRSSFLVNLAIGYVVLLIIAAYVSLFGSMATTGLAFVVGGLFLLGMGIYLEKKRRRLLARMRTEPAPPRM